MAELSQNEQSKNQYKELDFLAVDAIENPVELLINSTDSLAKYGGFDLLELAVDGVQNMNPERKARKRIFLTEQSKKGDREALKRALSIWTEILSTSGSISDMVNVCEQKANVAGKTLKTNLKTVISETRELERSYRSMAMFFKNTNKDKLKNITIVNADLEQLKDLDNTRFFDTIQEEIVVNYDKLDLRNNYSLLVLPGYLGSNKVVEKWAKMAHENKVMLITDFEHLDNPDDVMEMFELANLTSGDMYKSNVMMTCNWLVGREKYEDLGEDEELFIPPSTALAGTIYQTLMSQVAAGKKHGSLSEVDGVRFTMKKSEIASFEKMGLVPMVNEYGKVMAFSAKTLFNGDNLGLQTYSVVRVFDYITKVMMDFLNRRAFENFNSKTRKEIMSQIVKFLDSITGPGKLIENFSIKRFEQDPKDKTKIHLDIHMKPYFPAKNFLIKMDGQKGDDGTEWDSDYEQS